MKQKLFLGLSFFLGIAFLIFSASLFVPLDPHDSTKMSTVYTDTEGQLLYLDTNAEGEYFLPMQSFDEISEHFFLAALAAEDKRFFEHDGVDSIALLRALGQDLVHFEMRSGASTIDQQVAEIVYGQNRRNALTRKIVEMHTALRLNKAMTKEEIFLLWANHVSFGGNIVGLRAASLLYFGKEPGQLSLAEAALLASLPQQPFSLFEREKKPEQWQNRKERQGRILMAMEALGSITEEERDRALVEEFQIATKIFDAPHSIFLIQGERKEKEIILSISSTLQGKVEHIMRKHLERIGALNVSNAAAIAVDNTSGKVLFYVGSADFWNEEIDGQVDILQSRRQMGSTLKPFIYLMAFEKLHWGPETMLLDEPVQFDSSLGTPFAPKNFELDYMGKISVAKALGNSRNIPAVTTLEKLGVEPFFQFLESLGATSIITDNDTGLSSALGTAEMKPIDLLRLYFVLAREGEQQALCFFDHCPFSGSQTVVSRNDVLLMTSILSDNNNRVHSFGEQSPLHLPFPLAAKTGTTRNFRDSYAVGYTPDFTLLVWVGNANASSMDSITGATGAGEIFYDIALLLGQQYPGRDFPEPRGKTSALEQTPETEEGLRILSPLNGDTFVLTDDRPLTQQKIGLRVTEAAKLFIDGKLVGEGTSTLYLPEKGQHRFRAEWEDEVAEVNFTVR